MGDFHQPEGVTTLHRLRADALDTIEDELREFSRVRPISLVLPSLYSELEGQALQNIVAELKSTDYISQIIVTLGDAGRDEFESAKEFFSVLPHPLKVIWNDGERMGDLYDELERIGLGAGGPGKGRAAWMAYGYVLAGGGGQRGSQSGVIALHDCDIVTYNRELLARLCYPVASTRLSFEFCKGYYMRVTDKMFGRVTRLFITPLLRALIEIVGHNPLLVFLDSFKYPLAGEFAMRTELALINRTPSDWGLEIGSLAEVYRNVAAENICQTEICDNYDHKHQELSENDPTRGLLKMCADISKTLFYDLQDEGIKLDYTFFDKLAASYMISADRMVKRYAADSAINGLDYDFEGEQFAVETFIKGILLARGSLEETGQMERHLIPSWKQVTQALPGFLDKIALAVDKDNV